MMYEVRVSDEATTDLKGIYEYIAFDLSAPLNALGQLKRIEDNIKRLKEMPKRFPLYPAQPWHSRGVRYMIIDNYVAFYIADEDSRIVTVLRVLYSGRDISKIFEHIDKI